MTKRNHVSSENFGDLLIQGLEEAVAIQEGRLEPTSVRRLERTARDTTVNAPPPYTATRIAIVRKQLNVSQPVFASLLNVSRETVQAWEQGKREPSGASLRLLEVAEKFPETLMIGVTHAGERDGKRAASRAGVTAEKARQRVSVTKRQSKR